MIPCMGKRKEPRDGTRRTAPSRLSARWSALVAAATVATAAALMITSTRESSPTNDEVAHLPAGFTYLAWGDYRLNPEHPPLVKMLAALPIVLLDHPHADPASASFRSAASRPDQEWRFGREFLFSTPGNDAARLLAHARWSMVALAALVGVLVWLWARELWGETAAAAAAVAWALEPNLLANGPLVTTDVALAAFSLGAAWTPWRACRELTPLNAASFALFVALATVTKYSAVLLAPAAVAVLALRVLGRDGWEARAGARARVIGGRARKAGAALLLLAAAGLAAWGATWAAYSFRFRAARGDGGGLPLAAELAALATWGREPGQWQIRLATPLLAAAAEHRAVPEAYVFGLATTLRDARNRPSYLLGTVYTGARWYYFPVAVAVKTPLPVLLLAALGAVVLVRRRRKTGAGGADLARAFVVPVVFLGLAMASSLNLGVRHVLPVFPFLLLLAGVAGAELGRGRGRRIALAAAGVWLLAGTIAVFPSFLAYFNEGAGGPDNGLRWLADSNLDWGQDLPRLQLWMKRHSVARLNLCYFGSAEPDYYGIDYNPLPGCWGTRDGRRSGGAELPGYVAISASNLAGVGLQSPELWAYYKRLLRRATLVDKVGYSIFVYRVQEP